MPGRHAADKLEQSRALFKQPKDIGKGYRFGLSQALGFAKQSGGEITVTSALARFDVTIYLPKAEKAADGAEAVANRRGGCDGRPRTLCPSGRG